MSEDEIIHYGILRKSGRYPWGSGGNAKQRHKDFLGYVDDLKRQNMSESQIATSMGISTTQLRALKSIAKNQERAANQSMARRLKEKNMSNVAIGARMGLNESSVRALLSDSAKERNDVLTATSDWLRQQVDEKTYLDFGTGTELYRGISKEKLNTAVAILKEEGYTVHYVKVKQVGTDNYTSVKVLAPPGTPYSEVYRNQDKIQNVVGYTDDGGRTWNPKIKPPLSIDSKRVEVRYGDEGGSDRDGVIEIRRGVDDLSMGNARYAQVRVAVDKDYYLKGMAMFADDLPPGVDIRFNTNKTKEQLQAAVDAGKAPDVKRASMKAIKDDPENPFGTIVRQRTDEKGNVTSALNIVNEEGVWDTWSTNLSSQMLSKQSSSLAREQLGLRYDTKKAEYDEIKSLTNPAVKKKLLQTFSDNADASAVHLKAAGLPRTAQKVILPINSLKDTEIYAPTFRDGERVVLIRHPHGGIFEIPELVVNNRNPDAKRLIQNAVDAVGINAKVAKQLSGADFDGDTVLVIPNNRGKIQTKSPLEGLKDFDPQEAYPAYEGMPKMSARTKQIKMGDISNLITDMTIRGANDNEIAAAVRHSMVVIDAEKHNLNWKQSAIDNNIAGLKEKYQGKSTSGATTLISRSSREVDVPLRKPRSAKDGGPIDPLTGKKVYEPLNETYVIPAHTKVTKSGKTVNVPEKVVTKTFKSKEMAETDDAYTLSSGTVKESVYADYANRMKALANDARKEMLATKPIPYSPSAKAVYSKEVASLNAKLNIALKNAPLERQAQIVANTIIKAKREAKPDMEPDELKKLKGMVLQTARDRVGAKKTPVVITPLEWEAIQAGAISNDKLTKILDNTDIEEVRKLATPRENPVMNVALTKRAQSMLASGYTQAEVADALGIPTSTLSSALDR